MSRTPQHTPHKSVATETGRDLLTYVQHAAEQQCALISENSQTECKSIVAAARKQANRRVREAITAARRTVTTSCEAERAHIRSRLRAIELGNTAGQVASLLPDVRETLADFWKDEAACHQWIRKAGAQASHTLPTGTWHIEFAPGPTKATVRHVLAEILGETGTKPELTVNTKLDAGIRFRHGDVMLDASSSGLLAHPNRITALYLGFLKPDEKRGSNHEHR